MRRVREFATFGAIRQNGYVVRELEPAIRHWIDQLGVGPWYVFEHVPVDNFVHRGESGTLDMTIALAHCGFLQVELIVQHNDQPSAYREYLDTYGPGLHHLGFWPPDMDAALEHATACGFSLISGGQIGADGRFRYFEPVGPMGGACFELAEVGGRRLEWFEDMAERSTVWDGSDPIIVRRR